jgi:hypothetical protein
VVPGAISQRTSLVLLLIGALALRVGWVLHLPVDESALNVLPDQVEYLELGKSLLHKHSLEFFDARFGQTVRAYRTPGYPILIALCGANLRIVRIVQALIDTSTVLATWLLARKWLPPAACGFAGLLVALNPFLIYFTGLILSETLFIAMLAWGMALLTTERLKLDLPGFLLLSLSVLVRPGATMLPAIIAFISPRGRIFLAIFLVVIFAWMARNKLVVGDWVLTTNGGITMYDGFNPHADGSSNQSIVQNMPELRDMGEVDRSRYLNQLARDFIRNNPTTVIWLTFKKIARTWSPIPLSDEYGSKRLYVLIAACYSIPFDLLVLWGLWSGPLPRAAKVYLLIPALYFTAAHALSVGSLRYRIPAEVPMAVLAVAGFKIQDSRFSTDAASNPVS